MKIEYVPIEEFMKNKDSGIYNDKRGYKVHPEDFKLHCNKCNWKKGSGILGSFTRKRENCSLLLSNNVKRGFIEVFDLNKSGKISTDSFTIYYGYDTNTRSRYIIESPT